ncbi:MAG: hypothetical protein JNK05_28790 [Myxococcales bacterium]|nr:hypothetical protein [Myxococcales bacterium]
MIAAVGFVVCAGCEAPRQTDAGLALDVVAPPETRCELSTPVWPERNTAPPQWGSGRTLTYAVSEMTVDETPADATTPIAGFDLDGRFNDEFDFGACDVGDFVSALDCENNCAGSFVSRDGTCARRGCVGRSCRGGVDNNLPSLVDALDTFRAADFEGVGARRYVARAYRQGQAALVVQVSGVDSLESDELVAVRVVRAVPLYSAPDAGACSATFVDQRYAVARRAVLGDDPTRPIVRDGVGRIHRGVLRARFADEIHLPFIDGGPSIRDWAIESAQFAVNLSDEAGRVGNLGGAITTQTLLPSFGTEPEPDRIGLIVAAYSDLPNADGLCRQIVGCRQPLGRYSIGVHFSLVRAVLEPRVLDAPPIGACPSSPLVPRDDGGVYERFDASSFCRR